MRPGHLPCSSITTWSSSLVPSSFVTNGVLLRRFSIGSGLDIYFLVSSVSKPHVSCCGNEFRCEQFVIKNEARDKCQLEGPLYLVLGNGK